MSFHVQRALALSLVTIYKFWALNSEELPVFRYIPAITVPLRSRMNPLHCR